ncbi:MAG: type I methionyl aminopeptidase [Legionellales bacterium]|nr:type I methionyl aminopeptidase [Legionellales bacterium]|tara:strand:+ start:241 stop:1077 length:837 start_codon:yes stop_codon:yes gene_type:complete
MRKHTNTLSHFRKNLTQIEKMRVASQYAAQVLTMIEPHVKAGILTEKLDEICHDYITQELKARPACLGYQGFPKSICTSINHVICHGVPGKKKLKNGDIINIDVTVEKDGFIGDTSRMFIVGKKPSAAAKKVCQVAQECLYLGIQLAKPGNNINAIGKIIEQHATANHCSTVHEFCGHGIGQVMHENGFQVLHYDQQQSPGQLLEPGLTFTIEPMINLGSRHIKQLPDGWTVVTKDHTLSAQWEHTILIKEEGAPEILTLRADENIEDIFSITAKTLV